MKIDIITLFPEMFTALSYGIVGRAQDNQLLSLTYWNPRDFAKSPWQIVDDRPFGGGPGMVLQVAPVRQAITAARASRQNNAPVYYLAPEGQPLNHTIIQNLSQQPALILLAGRYEGIDQRVIDRDVDAIVSIGDYVVSGGELPIMVLVDAITRLLPNALGHAESANQDSFSQGLLDCPHYTRPETIDGQTVPSVLLSGNHQAINHWRLQQALGRTLERRPDLLKDKKLSKLEQQLLDEYRTSKDN